MHSYRTGLILKKMFILLLLFVPVVSQINAQTDWVQISTSLYYDVFFDSPSVGYVVGDLGVVRKTSDGGITWKTVLSDADAAINQIEFGEGGSRGYGINRGNSLFYASAGGENWTKVHLPDNEDPMDVSIDYDSQSGYHAWIAATSSVYYCQSFSNQFIKRSSGIATGHSPHKIKFIDEHNGFLFARGMTKSFIYYTSDGGINWNPKAEFDFMISAIWFSTGGNGLISGSNNDNTVSIYRTQDFGSTWTKLNTSAILYGKVTDIVKEDISNEIFLSGEFIIGNQYAPLIFNDSPFFDNWQTEPAFSKNTEDVYNNRIFNSLFLPSTLNSDNMYVAGDDLYHSTVVNNSKVWNSAFYTVMNYTLNDIHFFDSKNGFAVGGNLGIMKTSDSGENWTPLHFESGSNQELFKIFFLNSQLGWACGSNGIVFKTSDAGVTWTKIATGAQSDIHDIHFVNQNRGIAVGGSFVTGLTFTQLIATTDDGGNTWQISEKPNYANFLYDDELRSIFFINNNEGWIAGGGNVMFTSNQGTSWQGKYAVLPNTGGMYNINDIYFSDGNIGIAVGGGYPDKIWRTTDSGVTWTEVHSYGGVQVSDIDHGGYSYWAIGSGNIYQSNVFGSSWSSKYDKNYWGKPASIDIIDQYNGFASGGRSFAKIGTSLLTTINVNDDISEEISTNFKLNQNYPNPFNPNTTISFYLPKTVYVELKVYDLLGREIITLVRETKNAGNYNVTFNGDNIPSGVYFYRINAENFTQTKKLILLK